jgi:hypothetical protein
MIEFGCGGGRGCIGGIEDLRSDFCTTERRLSPNVEGEAGRARTFVSHGLPCSGDALTWRLLRLKRVGLRGGEPGPEGEGAGLEAQQVAQAASNLAMCSSARRSREGCGMFVSSLHSMQMSQPCGFSLQSKGSTSVGEQQFWATGTSAVFPS